MKIAIGADHGGFDLKTSWSATCKSQGHEVLDLGTSSHEAVDYPVFALAVAQAVADGRAQRGVMIDGAGIGSCMVANKVPGVRAAMAYDLSSARNGREHNDANVLTLGAGLIGAALAVQIVDVFLTTDCKEARHQRRVAMIDDVEKGSAPPAAAPPPPPTRCPRRISTASSPGWNAWWARRRGPRAKDRAWPPPPTARGAWWNWAPPASATAPARPARSRATWPATSTTRS